MADVPRILQINSLEFILQEIDSREFIEIEINTEDSEL
ncbi:hypothetical protein LCGC14_0987670 [marine sediment metagenome]|uniref:Uncharacterized protein n=1 Tax=marine sediment metagenome TaxID=412755 RepID=A0A0F9N6T3_9ZZZZ